MRFFNILFLVIFSPVYLLTKLVPKNKKLYIYGSSLGLHFADNSKYLFLYASKNIDQIKSVFISKDKLLVKSFREKGYRFEYLYSFKGLITVLRAKKAFLSHSATDIHPLLMGGTEIIQLWHGTPLKKIGYDADWRIYTALTPLKHFIRRILYFIFPFLYSSHLFNNIVISSEAIIKSFQTAFKIKAEKINIIGQPRNDCFNPEFLLNKDVFPEIEHLENLKKKFDTIIAWLPTHRRLMGKTIIDLMDDFGFDLKSFDSFFKKNRIAFIAKPHFLEKNALFDKVSSGTNIIIYNFTDPYPLLKYTDILITDYSSVYFDFLLVNRPIIFTPFDKEQYCKKEADFYFDYENATPGPKCFNWDDIRNEILKAIGYLLSKEPDPFEAKRLDVSSRFNFYKDNFSSLVVKKFFELDR